MMIPAIAGPLGAAWGPVAWRDPHCSINTAERTIDCEATHVAADVRGAGFSSQAGWYRTSLAQAHNGETIMFKTLVAALILATASVALTPKANAGPTTNYNPTQPEANYFDRASKVWDGGAQ
jgi:hypothetical protein